MIFCPVFKWSDRVIRRTIWILDILDHETAFIVLFSDHHLSSELHIFHIFESLLEATKPGFSTKY